MARSGRLDPIETFRFDVRIIAVSLAPGNLANNFRGGSVTQFGRIGFSEVETPEFTTATMEYRENLDNFVMRKIPGLMRYNEIEMKRGVLAPEKDGFNILGDSNSDFYRWLTRVNANNAALSIINEIAPNNRNALLKQSENFRKDIIIIARDREGRAAKRWYLLNAFPVFYKGASNMDAKLEEKSVETLRITYELAFELPSVADAAKEFIANITDSPFADIADDIDLDNRF